MGQQQMELYKRIDEILFYKWDPIGISDSDWGRDEYHAYLPKVFRMALEQSSPESIAEYLSKITTERMGLSAAKEHDLDIAIQILEVKDAIGL
uniref:hypothetical protein n=1 Tax=Shewanella baltica TaxID=62322 RepID=UPI00404730DC